jgi:hypothetical protein
VIEWAWSDGWILMSLFLARGGAEVELHEVIAIADATNHAIPTAKELTSAFTRFSRCGLLVVTDGSYKLAPEFRPSIRKASKSKGGLFQTGKKGLDWLRNSGLTESSTKRIIIRDAKAKAAYERYIKRMHNN